MLTTNKHGDEKNNIVFHANLSILFLCVVSQPASLLGLTLRSVDESVFVWAPVCGGTVETVEIDATRGLLTTDLMQRSDPSQTHFHCRAGTLRMTVLVTRT